MDPRLGSGTWSPTSLSYPLHREQTSAISRPEGAYRRKMERQPHLAEAEIYPSLTVVADVSVAALEELGGGSGRVSQALKADEKRPIRIVPDTISIKGSPQLCPFVVLEQGSGLHGFFGYWFEIAHCSPHLFAANSSGFHPLYAIGTDAKPTISRVQKHFLGL
ncbi:MAG: hypothetical protein AAB804_00800 [Patescibacteria group bacterium]